MQSRLTRGLDTYIIVNDKDQYFYGYRSGCSISVGGYEEYYLTTEHGPDWKSAHVFYTRKAAEKAVASGRLYRMGWRDRLAVVGGPGEPVDTYFAWLMRDTNLGTGEGVRDGER